ncbi:ABC transporter ATP-binding protein [Christiangramia forsetii]|uniref:ABC-type transporter ATP-binding and permease component n=2 Tax=Christiangramia forsetii TaxID=411153 RepID=A0LYG5_CHRFK|nr:ABC transporter ATP-binding protein [Christiangramia forsetii]GGG34258.1 xenobiotic ABC transporter ATP-binding protein [Christiangramia forsetii]CAL65410.1 ABC-type transporter ATP-binding and permease component [Christiangramia forsetii KT0803]
MASKTGNAFDMDLFKRLLSYTNPYKRIFYFVGVAAILMSLFAVLRPILLQETVDEALIPSDFDSLIYYVSLMMGVLVLEVLFQFCFIYYANWLGQEVVRDIRVKLFKHMLGFRMKYYDKSAVGRLVTRAVSDIETIASIFSQGLFMIISDLLKMFVVVGVMFYKSWELTLLVLTILPFIIYATRVFQKKMKLAFEEVRTQVANLNTFVQERITGMKIVQLFTREKTEYANFKEINDKHRNAWVKTVWYNSIFFPIAEMSTSITIGLIVWFGGLRVVAGDDMSLGIIIAFIELSQMLFRPLRQIADKFNTLQMGMVAANRVFDIIDTEANIEDNGTLEIDNFNGDIQFKDVRFSYVDDEEVLKGISFKVNPGETVAIVGATGAGKSTIINLLSRFYEIDSGTILVDNTDIKDIKLKSLRAQIAVVLQNVFLFADTVMNNINLDNPDISDEDVINAAKQIGIHEFITSLPGGYSYNVKERGAMLSSGQRQLISFLRAYVSNPSILVLDEATSSVDSYSEQLIQDATDKITEGRTSIVIAHRLATIKKADKIIVMDEGKIVEIGNHKELLQKTDGYYRKLYEVQFKEEEAL